MQIAKHSGAEAGAGTRNARAVKIAFWGQFGARNFGNECTLHAMLQSTRRYLPDASLLCVCSQPAEATRQHGIPAISFSNDSREGLLDRAPGGGGSLRRLLLEMRSFFSAIIALRSVDLLLMTGTGMLTDNLEGYFGVPFQLMKWSIAARIGGAKVAFVSVGTEQLRRPLFRRMVGIALSLASYRSFRDPLSRERAVTVTPRVSNDPLFPDLAFSLPPALFRSLRRPDPAARRVAVGIYRIEHDEEANARYVDVIGSFIVWLLDRGHAVRVVIGDAEYDERARLQIHQWLADRGRTVEDSPAATFEQLLAQLADSDVLVATRFHNLQLALMLGRPVISVAHESKNDQLMNAMGLQDFALSIGTVTLDDLCTRFERMTREFETLRARIDAGLERNRERLDVQYDSIFSPLQAPAVTQRTSP